MSLYQFATQTAGALNRRRTITVDLPEFLVRAIAQRVEEANEDAQDDELVDFNDVIEWLLVTEITSKRFPCLEETIPGFTAAMASWWMKSMYQPPDDEE
ncbi:MAG TPA: hypothetical protein VF618_16875 [Thermoanaerobaculia bacterium]